MNIERLTEKPILTSKWYTPGVLIIVVGFIVLAFSLGLYFYSTNEPHTVEVTEPPKFLAEQIKNDAQKAGIYIYDANNADGAYQNYVLLSFGEVVGVTMTVDWQFENGQFKNDSVYFTVDTEEVQSNQPAVIYRLYKTTANNIGCNELKLINPTYGVGTTGCNIGWLEIADKGSYYITPLLDISVPDRVFTAKANLGSLTHGLYDYNYEVTASGPVITSVKPIDQFKITGKVRNLSTEANTVDIVVYDSFSEQEVLVTPDISDTPTDIINLLSDAEKEEYEISVMLKDNAGVLKIANAK